MASPKVYDNSPLHVFPNAQGNLQTGAATITAPTTLRAANDKRRSITVKALTGGGILYVGGAGVTTATGFEVKGGESYTSTHCTDVVAVDASASVNVTYIEEVAGA